MHVRCDGIAYHLIIRHSLPTDQMSNLQLVVLFSCLVLMPGVYVIQLNESLQSTPHIRTRRPPAHQSRNIGSVILERKHRCHTADINGAYLHWTKRTRCMPHKTDEEEISTGKKSMSADLHQRTLWADDEHYKITYQPQSKLPHSGSPY